MIRVNLWMLAKSSQSTLETCYETIIWIIYSNMDDSLIIAMVHVSLDLRCSRISWMLILYFDFILCCLSKVHMVMIEYNLRYSKVIE